MFAELIAPLTTSVADGAGDQMTVAFFVPGLILEETLAGVLMIGGSLSEFRGQKRNMSPWSL